MEYRDNGTRFKNYCEWESVKQPAYDYERKGLVQHILSHKIAYTDNPFLKVMLKYYEMSIFHVLKYIDRLKHFKNCYWKNR